MTAISTWAKPLNGHGLIQTLGMGEKERDQMLHRQFQVRPSKLSNSLISALICLLLIGSCLTLATAPCVNAATNWTLTTSISGSQSSDYGTVSVSGTETIHLTESNGQVSGTGDIELTMSGMGMTMYSTGTETLTGTVSADRTAHLTITRAFAQATMNVGGQSMSVPASEMDVPLDTPYDIKLQDGFTQNYDIPDFGLVTLTVRSGGDSGQHKVTFTQTGVPSGTAWWVKLNGVNKTSTAGSMTFDINDGSYAYQAGIACPASPDDFPLELSQIRTTSSGAIPTDQATVADSVFIDGVATKPDDVNWYRFLYSSGPVNVNGQDVTVDLSADKALVSETDTITLHYLGPNGADFTRGAAASYETSFFASIGPETFDILYPALLVNHTGNWQVTASAEIRLSTLDYDQTFTVESNTLHFYVDFAGPTTTLTISVNGVNNALSMYTSTNGATASDPTYAQSGDGYDVSFQLTGPTGNSSTITIVIPKTAVPSGFVPQTKINGVTVEQQYTEDSNYYYVSFEAHFSTDQVTIHFSPQTTQSTPTPTPTAATSTTSSPTPSTSGLTTSQQIRQDVLASGVKDKSLDDAKTDTGIFNDQNGGVDIYQPTLYTARYYARALSYYLLVEKGWDSYEMYVFDSPTHLVGVAVAVYYSQNGNSYVSVFDPLTYDNVFDTYDGNGDNTLTNYKMSDKVGIGRNLWITFGSGYSFDSLGKDGNYLVVSGDSFMQSTVEQNEQNGASSGGLDSVLLYGVVIAVVVVVFFAVLIVSMQRRKKSPPTYTASNVPTPPQPPQPQQTAPPPPPPVAAPQPPPEPKQPPPPQNPSTTAQLRFCPHCGRDTSVYPSSKFCPFCGKPLQPTNP
jgi:hypothetical protein